MAQLCQDCSCLNLQRSDFTSSPAKPQGKYHAVAHSGTFGRLRQTHSTCSLCRLIWLALHRSGLAQAADGEAWTLRWAQNTNDYQSDNESLLVQDMFESTLYPCFGADGSREDYGVQLIDDQAGSGFLRGRLVNDTIDMEIVASWLGSCRLGHGEHCVGTQHGVELREGFRLGVLPYYQRERLHCEHASRAWTYQETCLSPRCLVVLNGFVYCNCNAAVYSEHVHTHAPGAVPETSANTHHNVRFALEHCGYDEKEEQNGGRGEFCDGGDVVPR